MKNIILKIATLATLLVGLLFTACNKEEIIQQDGMPAYQDGSDSPKESSSVTDTEIIDFLGCHGFDIDSLKEMDGYVLVEKDILFDKEGLTDLIHSSNDTFDFDHLAGEVDERQYANASGALVSMTRVSNIKYYIDWSVTALPNIGISMGTEIINACNNWQNVTSCRVAFSRVYSHSEADLSFFADNSTSSVLPAGLKNLTWNPSGYGTTARACFPNNQRVGRFISINDGMAQFPFAYTAQRRQNIVTHEIGHTLGLRHDQGLGGSGYDDCGTLVGTPFLIAGTPFADPGSVMVSGNTENPVSPNDRIAIQFMYPDSYSVPTINNIISTTPGYVTLQMQTITGQLPYRALVLRYNMAGTLQQSNEFLTPAANASFTVPCPANGMWNYKVVYVNYGSWGTTSNSYTVLGGTYKLIRQGTNKALDAKGCGNWAGTDIQLWDDNGYVCQRWVFQLQSDGSYEIKRKDTSLNLDAKNCGNWAGSSIQLWHDNNQNCQRWLVTRQQDGSFELKRKDTVLNLDAKGCASWAGANIQLWHDNNLNCQRWMLTQY